MAINKINAINFNSVTFGRRKEKQDVNNTNKTNSDNKKKLLLVLNDLAIAGAVIVAARKKDLNNEKLLSGNEVKKLPDSSENTTHKAIEQSTPEAVETHENVESEAAENNGEENSNSLENEEPEAVETDGEATPNSLEKDEPEAVETHEDVESEVAETDGEATPNSLENDEPEAVEAHEDVESEVAETNGEASTTRQHETSDDLFLFPDEKADKTQQDTSSEEIDRINAEIKTNSEHFIDQNSEENVIPEKELQGLSLEAFQKSTGEFYKGRTYIDGEPYTGNIVLREDEEKIVAKYRNGRLKRVITCNKNEDGIYEPVQIKKYSTKRDGTKVIKVLNQRKIVLSDKKVWDTEKIIKIKDSSISILGKSPFEDFLGVYYKKQKDGSWKGVYEERVFDYGTGYTILPIDMETGKVLSRREYNKFFGIKGDNFITRLFKNKRK